MPLIEFTNTGLYCRQGDFYIDPWKPVKRAIITHAHSDHARYGSEYYLCQHQCKPLLQLRLGDNNYESLDWEESTYMNGVKVSLHPAGHMIGSAQVRVEYKGEVWVVSGDYKVEDDGLSGKFEPIKCNSFVSECTFGLPIYRWKTQDEIFRNVQDWILKNADAGKTSVLIAYSLGKAQRLLQCIPDVCNSIFVHGAIWNAHQTLLAAGWALPDVQRVTPDLPKEVYKGKVIIAPPSAEGTPWMKKFSPYAVGICSGWMQVRGNARRKNADAGFALSDHADWSGLLQAIKATSAEKVYVTHGFTSVMSRYLNEIGIDSAEVKTEYGNEEEENSSSENISEKQEQNIEAVTEGENNTDTEFSASKGEIQLSDENDVDENKFNSPSNNEDSI